MIASPPSDFCHAPTLRSISERACEVDGLLERSLGIVELPDAPRGRRRRARGRGPRRRRIARLASHLESLPAQGEGRIGVPGRWRRREARACSRSCGRRRSGDAPGGSPRAPVAPSRSRRERTTVDPIIVCAFARVLGEPEPSASSSSRRSRPSCSWFRSCQKRQSAAADPQADLRLAGVHRPVERGADVVPLCVEALEPLALLRAEQARLGLLGQHEVEACVPASDGLAVAARRQTLERVLADGLEHPQARLVAGCVLGREQVVAEERLDPLQDVEVGLLGDVLGARSA